MSLPYLPLYVGDYEADTAHLTILEDGAYSRLLRLMWRTPGCSVPDDEAWIFRMMRATSDDERAAIRTIIAEFCERKGGRILSLRLQREFKKADETSRRRSDAGKRGGRPKVVDIIGPDEKPGLSQDKAGTKHPEPEPYIAVAADARAREELVVDGFDREEHVDISVTIGKMVRERWPEAIWFPGDTGRIKSWLAGGWARETIEEAVAAKIQGMSQPPRSFKFFEYSIADKVASLNAPLPTGNADHGHSANPRPSGHSNLTLALARRAAQAGS